MHHLKFNEAELKVVSEIPSMMPGAPPTPLYDFPVTRREAYIATMERKPLNYNMETLLPPEPTLIMWPVLVFEDTPCSR